MARQPMVHRGNNWRRSGGCGRGLPGRRTGGLPDSL